MRRSALALALVLALSAALGPAAAQESPPARLDLPGPEPLSVGPFLAELGEDGSAGLPSRDVVSVVVAGGDVHVETAGSLFRRRGDGWERVGALPPPDRTPDVDLEGLEATDVAVGPRSVVVATPRGAFDLRGRAPAERLLPAGDRGSWAPAPVDAVAYDEQGALWLACREGVARRGAPDGPWDLTPARELPWNRFRAIAPDGEGGVWLATDRGLIHLTPGHVAYRQGRRWLPSDDVRDVTVDADGQVWAATADGVGRIRRFPMTLAEKARRYEDAIERYHLRTRLGFVERVGLEEPGDPEGGVLEAPSDNDGLWTGMYGAAMCFAYAVTGEERHRARARRSFEALRFLSEVTQGGPVFAPPGFPARTVLPTSAPDPNRHYTPERDREKRDERDRLWKVIAPRWPVDETGEWYWKCDTSSDELDGHFFLYAQYHDLVAETPEERAEVRAVVRRIADHLLAHGYRLVDHDGRPTRWANFAPESLNHDLDWFEERGLNSLSILSYLAVAARIAGEEGGARYREAARELIERHAYAQNVLQPKVHMGPGTGNQSDDEMAVMGFYDLLHSEADPELRATYGLGFRRYWELVHPERNPFFELAYAASCWSATASTAWGPVQLTPGGSTWLSDALDALRRYPLDLASWSLENSHRLDVVRLDDPLADGRPRGHLRSGGVLPIDERRVAHWNADPWRLDYPGDGRRLADGAAYLLAYWLGRYHGFFEG